MELSEHLVAQITPEEKVEHTNKCIGTSSHRVYEHCQEGCLQQDVVLCGPVFLKCNANTNQLGSCLNAGSDSVSGVGCEMMLFQQTLK